MRANLFLMLGNDTFRYNIFFRQVLQLTLANLKSRYRKTWAGFLWVVLSPLIIFGVQSVVFSRILKVPEGNYHLFLVAGLLPWIFIIQSVEMTTSIFVNNGQLLKAFPAHPLVYLLAQLVDNLINFLAALFLIVLPVLIFTSAGDVQLLLLPVALLLLTAATFSLAWLLSTTQVFLRDTRFVISFLLHLSFFGTPIFYSKDQLPEYLQTLQEFNPVYIMILPVRACLYSFNFETFMVSVAKALILVAVLFTAAALLWKKKKNELYFTV